MNRVVILFYMPATYDCNKKAQLRVISFIVEIYYIRNCLQRKQKLQR